MVTKEKILEALKNVDDPDLHKDIVSLGMVHDIHIEEKKVSFKVMLTTPACPMKDAIHNACINAVKYLVSQDLEVNVEMGATVTTGRNDSLILPHVKNIIAVASGKGGVGKSTVAANLAAALALEGAKTGLLDADIYGPSLPTMFGLNDTPLQLKEIEEKTIMLPHEKYNVKLMSIGFMLKPGQAVAWRGPMLSSALKQMINDVEWNELDYLIIDLPPGTGDIQITLSQNFPLTGVVLVTTPQQVALDDALKAAAMFTLPLIDVPLLGVVENMSWFTPAEHANEKYYIFGEGGGKKLAETYNINLLAQIPLIASVCQSGDAGKPEVLNENSLLRETYIQLAKAVAHQVSVKNSEKKN